MEKRFGFLSRFSRKLIAFPRISPRIIRVICFTIKYANASVKRLLFKAFVVAIRARETNMGAPKSCATEAPKISTNNRVYTKKKSKKTYLNF